LPLLGYEPKYSDIEFVALNENELVPPQIKSNQIKNQITFIVTSPQHKCLGE